MISNLDRRLPYTALGTLALVIFVIFLVEIWFKESSKDPERIFGALIEGPTTNSSDSAFQKAIANSEPASATFLLKRLNEIDDMPSPAPRGEFETSSDYEKRFAIESAKKPYGVKCYAFISEGDFSYDADTQTAQFFTPYKGGIDPEPDTTHKFENVTIDDESSNRMSIALVTKVPIEIAKRLSHNELRIARVFTLSGKVRPC